MLQEFYTLIRDTGNKSFPPEQFHSAKPPFKVPRDDTDYLLKSKDYSKIIKTSEDVKNTETNNIKDKEEYKKFLLEKIKKFTDDSPIGLTIQQKTEQILKYMKLW